MKIGIMTHCTAWQHNYGQILQSYALQRYLREQGYEVFFIRYDRIIDNKNGNPFWKKAIRALNPYIFVRHFYLKHKHLLLEKEDLASPRYFEEFVEKYINESSEKYSSLEDLKKNPPSADVYIVGSDQVWSCGYLKDNEQMIRSFFLDFGSDNILRISYAASFGSDKITQFFKKITTPLIKNFDFVSVREKTGVDLCRQLGYENAKWVCDPTLLFKADDYRRVYNENPIRRRNKKYIFMYAANGIEGSCLRAVIDFAKKKELEILCVNSWALCIKNAVRMYPTIPEWLYLIDNAEYVITGSFHGSLFSTVFGTQYVTIRSKGKGIKTETRVDSLFEMCNIEPRWINDKEDFSILDKPYIADISSFRAESMNFLEKALNMTEGGGGTASNRICASLQKAA